MAKKSFTIGEPLPTIASAEEFITKLQELDNVSDPFKNQGRCPYKNEEPCGKFLGFTNIPYTSTNEKGEVSTGYWAAIDLEGQKPVAVSCFLKYTEDALDEDGAEKHLENEGGLADICKQFDSIKDPRLYKAIIEFFSKGKHQFAITEYLCYIFGKKQRKHLVNII